MFRRLDDSAPERVEISLDGEPLELAAGMSLAAALLLAGELPTRYSAVSGAARAPFCMMGACFECVVDVDGIGACRACRVEVSAGMHVRRRRSAHDDGGAAA